MVINVLFILALIIYTLGCTSGKFVGDSPTKPISDDDDLGEVKPSAVTPAPIPVSANCVEESMPLRVMVVLDVSYSMDESLDQAKANIKQVLANLKAVKPLGAEKPLADVKAGIYLFADNESLRREIPLTSDAEVLSQELNSVKTTADPENTDGPEESLSAVERALEIIERDSGSQDSINVVLIISDNYGHNGGHEGMRNYSLEPLKSRLTGKTYTHFFLYDATPQENLYEGWIAPGLPPYESPAAEWDELRKSWKAHWSANENGGKALGFPFAAKDLLESVPKDLASSLKICP